jgi:Putative Actinobacterial Holin-X, holin superfamily III
MPTHATDGRGQGLGAAAKSVSEHLSSIFRLELELATMELRRKVVSLGLGIGFALGAALFLLFMLGFALAAIAAGLATTMAWWEALLIVTGLTFVLAGLLGFLALMKFQRGTPPVPEQAIREAKLTTEALKSEAPHA